MRVVVVKVVVVGNGIKRKSKEVEKNPYNKEKLIENCLRRTLSKTRVPQIEMPGKVQEVIENGRILINTHLTFAL